MYHRLFTNANFAAATKTAILSATAFVVSDNYTNADHTKTRVVNNNTVKYSSLSYNANLPCEDSFSIIYNSNQNLPFKTACAVFDGHGGRQVAKYAEKHLLKFFKSYLQLCEIEDEFGIQDRTSESEIDSDESIGSNKGNTHDKGNSIESSILSTFEHIENGLRSKLKPAFDLGFGSVARVGACACVAVLNNDNTLTIANAGDCKAVIGSLRSNNGIIRVDGSSNNNNDNKLEQQQIPDSKFNSIKILNDLEDCDATSNNVKSSVSPTGTGEMTIIAKPMTSVHNACVEAEKKKLVKDHPDETLAQLVRCKHETSCYVKGRLQPTRSFGDFYLKYPEYNGKKPSSEDPYYRYDPNRSRHIKSPYNPPYITATPEITNYQINMQNDKFLILATDGLWDELTPKEACEIVNENIKKQGKDSIVETNAKVLLNAAMKKAAYRTGLTVEELEKLPRGKRRRSIHDDITIIVMEF